MTPLTFDDLLLDAAPAVRPLAEATRALVLDVLPDDVLETCAGTDAGYGWTRGYTGLICVIGFKPRWVTLGIADGATLPDPQNLLRGNGKRHRHIRVDDVAVLADPGVRALLEESLAVHPRP